MWLSGVLLLVCHYQVIFASKTIMTNEISMPSLGHKEEVSTFNRLQPKDDQTIKYHSARFERLKSAPNNIEPNFEKPTELESKNGISKVDVIEVAPSSETVTEVPTDFSPNFLETPLPPSLNELNVKSMPILKYTDKPSTSVHPVNFEGFEIPSTFAAPSTHEVLSPEMSLTSSVEKTTSLQVTSSEPPAPPQLPTENISEMSKKIPIINSYIEQRVNPTMSSVQPEIEFVENLPSQQIEVAAINTNKVEESTVSSTKAPKKRRHRRKQRKLRKIMKTTEAPTDIPTTTKAATEASTKLITALSTPASTTTTIPISTTTNSITSNVNSSPISGTVASKVGESYLGGWNEDEAVIVTTSGPSLGYTTTPLSEVPASLASNDDKAIKEYYENYYAEWYKKHNQATNTPQKSASIVSREIKIELAKPGTSSTESASLQPFEISSPAAPTKEQLAKVCDYVTKISKSFGIKDLVGFAKNNCDFVKGFHPTATCEQIQHLMNFCATGIFEENR